MEYFFIAVSTRENLELCKKYALAGFPSTLSGAWAYSEINVSSFVTFLYGARAHNLYKVVKKESIANAENIPPWKPLHFRESGKTVYFPFRLHLEPFRELEEPIARPEFFYIAENLLQRGGYRKTHFQADQTTLQNVSQIGKVFKGKVVRLEVPHYKTFEPSFARLKGTRSPDVYQFKEVILQSLIRQHLSNPELFKQFLKQVNLSELATTEFEVLGEKALTEGHIDILAKEARPMGKARQIVIEVKLGKANKADAEQLKVYMKEIGEECVAGVLIAMGLPKAILKEEGFHFLRYEFEGINLKEPHTFGELLSAIRLSL